MTRVLVLGAQGFLGTHVVDELAAEDLVPVPGPPQDRLDLAESPVSLLHELLDRERPHAVVNATGCTAGAPELLTRHNQVAVRRLLEACRGASRPPRLVHLGSAAEYGPSAPGVPVHEDHPPRPATPYGRSKLAGTRAVLDSAAAGEVDGVVLRVFNPVGAGQPLSSLAGRVIAQVRSDPGAPLLLGRLDAVRDVVSARDVGRAVAAAVRCPPPPAGCRVLNIGSGRGVPVRELVEALRAFAGHLGPLLETGDGSERSAGVDWQQADVGRAAAVLGWRARDSVRQAAAAALGVPLPEDPRIRTPGVVAP